MLQRRQHILAPTYSVQRGIQEDVGKPTLSFPKPVADNT